MGISAFPALPPEVVNAFETQQAGLSAERAARLHEQAVVAGKATLICGLTDLVEKPRDQPGQYSRARFAPKSGTPDPAQLQLAPEDLETAMAETGERIAAVKERIDGQGNPDRKAPRKPRRSRALPENLPRDDCLPLRLW